MRAVRDNILVIAVLGILACSVAQTVYHIMTGR